jgi:CHRD domain.
MRNLGFPITMAAVGVLLMATVTSQSIRANNSDDQGGLRASAKLSTFNEVLPKGTGASGTFRARLSADGTTLNWTFTWTGLTGPPLFAHIHFAQPGVNGNVMTFLCGGPNGNPDIPAKPVCPQTTADSISGSTTAADIIALNSGATDQGLDLHDFATFLNAIRTGNAYANLHTTSFPAGEIRGQLSVRRPTPDDDDN